MSDHLAHAKKLSDSESLWNQNQLNLFSSSLGFSSRVDKRCA